MSTAPNPLSRVLERADRVLARAAFRKANPRRKKSVTRQRAKGINPLNASTSTCSSAAPVGPGVSMNTWMARLARAEAEAEVAQAKVRYWESWALELGLDLPEYHGLDYEYGDLLGGRGYGKMGYDSPYGYALGRRYGSGLLEEEGNSDRELLEAVDDVMDAALIAEAEIAEAERTAEEEGEEVELILQDDAAEDVLGSDEEEIRAAALFMDDDDVVVDGIDLGDEDDDDDDAYDEYGEYGEYGEYPESGEESADGPSKPTRSAGGHTKGADVLVFDSDDDDNNNNNNNAGDGDNGDDVADDAGAAGDTGDDAGGPGEEESNGGSDVDGESGNGGGGGEDEDGQGNDDVEFVEDDADQVRRFQEEDSRDAQLVLQARQEQAELLNSPDTSDVEEDDVDVGDVDL